MLIRWLILTIIVTFLFNFTSICQTPADSSQANFRILSDSTKIKTDSLKQKPLFQPIPKRAVVYSLLLPGLGQVYNRSYWKLPLVYGAFGYIIYKYVNANNLYTTYRDAYSYRFDNDSTTYNFPTLTSEMLRSQRDSYRQDRDFNVILLGLTYALVAIEAYCDAHLKRFNVSDNLALKFSPTLKINPLSNQPYPALSFQLYSK